MYLIGRKSTVFFYLYLLTFYSSSFPSCFWRPSSGPLSGWHWGDPWDQKKTFGTWVCHTWLKMGMDWFCYFWITNWQLRELMFHFFCFRVRISYSRWMKSFARGGGHSSRTSTKQAQFQSMVFLDAPIWSYFLAQDQGHHAICADLIGEVSVQLIEMKI